MQTTLTTREALRLGSLDNITVVIVFLQGDGGGGGGGETPTTHDIDALSDADDDLLFDIADSPF